MNDEQSPVLQERYSPAGTYQPDRQNARGAEDTALSPTIANMDRLDYMNMLAESRIVDIVWTGA